MKSKSSLHAEKFLSVVVLTDGDVAAMAIISTWHGVDAIKFGSLKKKF